MATRKATARATTLRGTLTDLDGEMDRALGRMIRWTNKVADLRAKRKRLTRELAKELAAV